MKVLGIETSCDETSAAVIEDGKKILSNIVSSQNDLHAKYGGVIPEFASRRHLDNIVPVVKEALDRPGVTLKDIDAIAVTQGPGLVGALLVGIEFAKAVAFSLDIPVIGINHLEGHLYAVVLETQKFDFLPALCIIVSGGHTELVLWKDFNEYELIGRTKDDAAGEAFDKVARLIGLNYPGGPEIEKLANKGNEFSYKFPVAKMKDKSSDFSFSGLKTSVANFLKNSEKNNNKVNKEDLAAGFQKSVIDALIDRTITASLIKNIDNIILTGGVASNKTLRERLAKKANENRKNVYFPSGFLCTDNAAMIACAGYYRIKKRQNSSLCINVEPNMRLV